MKKIRKVAIVGVGFMGGSLGMAMRRHLDGVCVWGYARSIRSLRRIQKSKTVDRADTSLEKVIRDADVVVIGLPVGMVIDYLRKISPFLKRGALVFDLGSSKKEIVDGAQRIMPKSVNFIGCHPLCGSEKSGVEFSRPDLYRGALCLVTASKRNKAAGAVKKIWQALGSKVVFMSPREHDALLSCVSHLPHFISFSLTQLVPQRYLSFAPTSLKDLTRISNSPAHIWVDIALSNKKNIMSDIRKFIVILGRYERLLRKGDRKKITALLAEVNAKQKYIV